MTKGDPFKLGTMSLIYPSLIVCDSVEDLMKQARWDGAHGRSRNDLLSDLSSKS